MIVIGLTGSIGMGKSTAAQAFARCGVPVFDADACVHALQGPGGAALPAIEAAFPGSTSPAGMDRKAIANAVYADPAARLRLERIIHPLVRRAQQAFLARCRGRRLRLALLDIPLLLESGGRGRCDLVVVVSAPAFIQARRVLARDGMTPQRLAAILALQMPDAEKRRRADIVIHTSLGKGYSFRKVRALVRRLRVPVG